MTRPPAASTSSRPAMKCDQSAPLIRMSGKHLGDQFARGVFIEERNRIDGFQRARPVRRDRPAQISGREGPFSRCTLESVFNARMRMSPSERACSSSRI